jgi:hypothetical protein
MLSTLAFLLLAAAPPAEQATTIPRQADTAPYERRDPAQGVPTDPLFDRELVATDDATFIRNIVENSRQAALDARTAQRNLSDAPLKAAAQAIGAQSEATTRKLEALAKRKGWPLPPQNPERASTLPAAGPHRANANFILHQISFHQATVEQFRAQIAGKGDAELRRTLREELPGYEKNLGRLLEAKP